MLWQIASVLIGIRLVIYYWKRRELYLAAARIPTPKSFVALPIIGHGYKFSVDNEQTMNLFRNIGRQSIENNNIAMKLWLGQTVFVQLTDATDVEYLLKSSLGKKSQINHFLREHFGNGSVFAPVSIWRHRRRMMAPAFSQRALNHFVAVFVQQAISMVKNLEKLTGGAEFSAWHFLSKYSMSSICETNLGVKLDQSPELEEHPFIKALNKVFALAVIKNSQMLFHSNFIFRQTKYHREMVESSEFVNNFITDIIRKKRKEFNERSNTRANDDDGSLKTFLEMLLENTDTPKGYTDEEIREEMFVIALAGTDTSAVSASFILGVLARHPDVQEKLFKELHEVFGESNRPLTKDDLPQLKYLEAVIKEGMRLYPPVPALLRHSDKKQTLPSGVTLAEGFLVITNIWSIQRSPKYWGDDANEFKPERFLVEQKHPAAAFMAFSNGPRNCIGNKYAMMSLKTVLSQFFRSYKVIPPLSVAPIPRTPWRENESYFRLTTGIMMRDVDNFMIRIEKRRY